MKNERVDIEQRYISQQALAEALEVSVKTVERYASEAGWTISRLSGRTIRYHRQEVEAWLERRTFPRSA